MTFKNHKHYILESISAAEKAKGRGDKPYGAMLVLPNATLIESDTSWTEKDLTNHAEMNVMRKASQMGFRNLKHAVLYSTVEPCPMCAAAAAVYGIKEVVFGAFSEDGFTKFFKENPFSFQGGILAEDCIRLLPKYLQERMRTVNESI